MIHEDKVDVIPGKFSKGQGSLRVGKIGENRRYTSHQRDIKQLSKCIKTCDHQVFLD